MKLDYGQAEQLKKFVLDASNPTWVDIEDFLKQDLGCEGDCAGTYAAAFSEFSNLLKDLKETQIEKIFSFISKRKIKDTPALRQKLSPEKLETLGYVDRYPTVAAVLW